MSPGRLKLKLILATILVLAGGFFIFQKPAFGAAGINKQINFQGKVVNTDGTNVSGGAHTFVFKIYNNTTLVWTDTESLTVTDGIFQYNLGSDVANAPLPGSVDFNTDNVYLGVEFDSNGEMAPRIQFTAAPYAFNADNLDGKGESAFALLAGRSGGQTLIGGTGSGDDLTFQTTSDVTKGSYIFSELGSGLVLSTSGTLSAVSNTLHTQNTDTGTTGVSFVIGSGTNETTNDVTLTFGNSAPETLVFDGNGTDNFLLSDDLDITGGLTATANISIAAGLSYTGAGAVTLSSTTNTLTLNSGNNILTIDSSDTSLTASGVTTLTLGANATITNASGNLIFQPAGSGTTATVQIGVGGGTGSATPDLLGLDTKNLTGDPAGFVGAMYYNVADAKFRCYEGAAWKNCDTTGGGGGTLQTAYDTASGNTILTTTGRNIAFILDEVATPTSFTIENRDTAGVSAQRIFNSIVGGNTLTNGLLIEETGAGTMTNGIQILGTAGAISNGITIADGAGGTLDKGIVMTGTITTAILDTPSIDISGAGAITGATGVSSTTGTFSAALAANGGITFDASTDTVGAFTAAGTIDMNTRTLSGTTGDINYTNFDVVGSSGNTDIGGTITAGSGSGVTLTNAAGNILADALVDCADTQILKWTTAGGWTCAADATGGGGAPNTAQFLDTTPAAFTDANTTEIWNDTTRPNIITSSATATVMISVHMHGIASNTTADAFTAARLVYTNDQTTPTCTSTQVGEIMVSGFTTTTSQPWEVSGTFLHTPSTVAEEIRYTVCSSTVGIASTDTPEDLRVDLVELGADLAENYRTLDESVSPGDIVAIDPSFPAGVKKSSGAYDKQAIGVISTNPGITLDDATSWGQGRSVPVALAGRIPVKVSAENGRVKTGDFLTSSSIPGVAMKATKAGPIIGQALQDFSYLDNDIGLVVAFVKTSYFTGTSLKEQISGLSVESEVSEEGEETLNNIILSKRILELLLTQKENNLNKLSLSEISTDRLAAGLEIITPTLVADKVEANTIVSATGEDINILLGENGAFTIGGPIVTNEDGAIASLPAVTIDNQGNALFLGTLTADAIVANKIVGLEIYTDKISGIDESVAALADKLNTLQTAEENIDLSSLGIMEKKGGLTIARETTFKEATIFEKLVTLMGNVIFHGAVSFEKVPTFNKDTAGYAIIKENADSVAITFDKEYAAPPVVNASLSLQQIEDKELRKTSEELLLLSDVKFIITNVTTKGFEIRIGQKALSEIPFSWQALAVKDVKTFIAEDAVVEDSQPSINEALPSASLPNETVQTEILPSENPPVTVPVSTGVQLDIPVDPTISDTTISAATIISPENNLN